MNLVLLASSIIVVILIATNTRRQKRNSAREEENFWARERRANSVRRKSLDGLKYISIPLETFPTHVLQQDSVIAECIETLEYLTSQKIVNLTGYSNTDLKLEYGTANITLLSEYDQNYTILVRTLQKGADVLLETGYVEEACILMEFAISTGTDVSRTYYQLAEYYSSQGASDRIQHLKDVAETIHSSSRDIILRHLNREYP